MKIIAVALIALTLAAAPPRRVPHNTTKPTATEWVYMPIGIWPLCLLGLQVPGCYVGMPETWWWFEVPR